MKQYKLSLSASSFDKMVKELNNYSVKLDKAKNLILKALADYTEQQIKFYIEQDTGWYDYIPTGNLLSSIKQSDIFNNTIKVYADEAIAPYAKYVEYGTGIRGSYTPHPDYDGQYSQSFLGQHAHRFMYNAFIDLSKNYMTIAKEVLRKEGLI